MIDDIRTAFRMEMECVLSDVKYRSMTRDEMPANLRLPDSVENPLYMGREDGMLVALGAPKVFANQGYGLSHFSLLTEGLSPSEEFTARLGRMLEEIPSETNRFLFNELRKDSKRPLSLKRGAVIDYVVQDFDPRHLKTDPSDLVLAVSNVFYEISAHCDDIYRARKLNL